MQATLPGSKQEQRAQVLQEVRAALHEEGRTQAWLAARVEEALGQRVSRPRMSQWLSGKNRLPRAAFECICKELRLPVRLMLRDGLVEVLLQRSHHK